MIWKRTLLICLLSLSACATPVPPASTTPSSTVTLTASASPTGTPTITSTPDLFTTAERISYDVNNDIWIYKEGMIENGIPMYFVFSGIEGQELRVYIQYEAFYDGGLIEETKIFDRNGKLVKSNPVNDFGGWEGKLPSTQDYIIYLTPTDDSKTQFILQIVNNPPRDETGYFTHHALQNSFEITYSQNDFKPSINENLSDVFSVSLDTEKYFAGTILQLSDLVISIKPNSRGTKCSDPLADTYYSTKETINGIPFEKFDLHDAATGTEADLLYYITAHNDTCLTIFVKTLYIRVDKFPDTGKKDFSRSILYTKIYHLLSTFKFIE